MRRTREIVGTPTTAVHRRSRVAAWIASFVVAACGSSPLRSSTAREPAAPHLRPGASPWAREHHAHAELPDPATTTRVSLDQLLAYADRRAPSLRVARSTRARAEAARVAAAPGLPDNPVIDFSAGPRITSDATGVDIEVGVSQSFEVSGERGRRLAAAERFAQLTEAEIEQARWTVHCDVHAAFHRALVLRERAALAARVVAFQEEVGSVVARRIAAGDAAPLASNIAQLEIAQVRQVSVVAAQAYLAVRLELAQLAGWPLERPPEPVGALDAPREPPALAHLVRVAMRHQPALRVRGAALREARSRVSVADREGSVHPAFGVRYQLEGAALPEGAQHIVLGTVALPLPTSRTNQGERARARADVTVAEAELGATRMAVEANAARLRAAVIAAGARLSSYGAELLPRLEQTIELLRRSFELGEIELLDVLVARERFLRIQSDVLDAHLDYFVALAELERAVGVEIWPDDHHHEEPAR